MITDLLKKEDLLSLIASWRATVAHARDGIAQGKEDAVKTAEENGWTDGDLADFDRILAKAETEAAAALPDDSLASQPEEVTQEEEDGTKDGEEVYIARSEALSTVQTILEMAYLEAGMVEQSAGAGLSDEIPAWTAARLDAAFKPPVGQALFYGPFDEPNPRFITEGIKAVLYRNRHGRVTFNRDPKIAPLGSRARLVLVGDWGSGIERAQLIAGLMRKFLRNADGRECHAVHLGDIYFSGWPHEARERFLKYWPVKAGETFARSWCLNGNHDMYCGGAGYFGEVLADSRFSGQAGCSHFGLENDDWQILGLDTAYEEWSLSNGQLGWAVDQRQRTSKKKGILMTHHQPYSDYENGREPKKLAQIATPLLRDNLTTAWLWGHEHRCAVYKSMNFPFAGAASGHLPFGACLGNGGIPTRPTKVLKNATSHYVLTDSFKVGFEKFGMFGFAVLDIDGPSASLTTVDEKERTRTFPIS